MREEDARAIATTFIASLDARGFRYALAEARRGDRFEWCVSFDVFNPGGHLMDGPVVVLVDGRTRKARLLEGL
jgi:hypothetical protein